MIPQNRIAKYYRLRDCEHTPADTATASFSRCTSWPIATETAKPKTDHLTTILAAVAVGIASLLVASVCCAGLTALGNWMLGL